jgi:hypothetical protein
MLALRATAYRSAALLMSVLICTAIFSNPKSTAGIGPHVGPYMTIHKPMIHATTRCGSYMCSSSKKYS